MRIHPVAVLLLSSIALAQVPNSAPAMVVANALLVHPSPSAPLSDWTSDRIRRTEQVVDGDAKLRGWRYAARQRNAPTLLFFNGNGMTVDRADSLYRQIASDGANVIVFDYRGIGFSTGVPDVMQFRRDALMLYDRLAASGPMVVYGFSLGTAMASYVASQRRVAGLILAGTIASAPEELPVYVRAHGIDRAVFPAPDAIEAFDEVAMVAHSSAPLLMLHGEADTLVPIAQGREVFAASPARAKQFVALPGASHNETVDREQARAAVARFMAHMPVQR